MSDKFYDFDKDDSFSEVYSDKITKKPQRKEFEVDIAMPHSEIKSTMPKKDEKPKKKKMSKGKKVLAFFGILCSCLIAYLGALAATIFGWNYLPSFEEKEASAIEDVEKADEYVKISDDGSTVEVVPMYKGGSSSSSSSSASSEKTDDSKEDETNNDEESDNEKIDENGENEKTDEGKDTSESDAPSSQTPAQSGDDEVINID